MQEPFSWRDLLKEMISDAEQRDRLAAETGDPINQANAQH